MTECRPVSLISVQKARQLSREVGVELDTRRFRANAYVDPGSGPGFGEDAWVGGRLRIGAKEEFAVVHRDPRCKMITLDPDTAQANPELMRRVAKGHHGTAAVNGAVFVEGVIRAGDSIVPPDQPGPWRPEQERKAGIFAPILEQPFRLNSNACSPRGTPMMRSGRQ